MRCLLFAAWLLVSAFVLPHTPFSQLSTWLLAILVAVATFLAADKPGARFAISALGVALAAVALLAPGTPLVARLNNVAVGAILFALSLSLPHAAPALRSRSRA